MISQSVKDVVQSLVDDGLVECEKIGTFVCYWAFPSRALQLVQISCNFNENFKIIKELYFRSVLKNRQNQLILRNFDEFESVTISSQAFVIIFKFSEKAKVGRFGKADRRIETEGCHYERGNQAIECGKRSRWIFQIR